MLYSMNRCILKSDAYSGSPVYDALFVPSVKYLSIWVTHSHQMRQFRVRCDMPCRQQCLAVLMRGAYLRQNRGGRFTEIIFTVNMPPIKNSPHKTGKSMLFFTFEMTLFSVMSINSQIYMTKPKQAQKTLSENTGKTFSVIMPPFSSKGGAKLRK